MPLDTYTQHHLECCIYQSGSVAQSSFLDVFRYSAAVYLKMAVCASSFPLERRLDFILIIISLCLHLKCAFSFEQELTLTIPPGREECFYHTTEKGHIIDIEYQVIDGGHGSLDINFLLVSPRGKILQADIKKTEGAHRQEAQESGDYKLCFDNSFSRISSKVVFFELIVESEGDDYFDDDEAAATNLSEGMKDEHYDVTVDDIQAIIDNVKARLIKMRHIQEQLRAFEARDRNLQERNFSRVNSWSLLQITVMVIVGMIQVVMLRSLFDDRSRVHKIWKITR